MVVLMFSIGETDSLFCKGSNSIMTFISFRNLYVTPSYLNLFNYRKLCSYLYSVSNIKFIKQSHSWYIYIAMYYCTVTTWYMLNAACSLRHLSFVIGFSLWISLFQSFRSKPIHLFKKKKRLAVAFFLEIQQQNSDILNDYTSCTYVFIFCLVVFPFHLDII